MMGVRAKGWAKTRLAILQRDGYECHYCGDVATEVDHGIPRVNGGTEDPDNLVASCMKCNRSKGKRMAPRRRFFVVTSGHPPAGGIIPPMRKLGPPEKEFDCE